MTLFEKRKKLTFLDSSKEMQRVLSSRAHCHLRLLVELYLFVWIWILFFYTTIYFYRSTFVAPRAGTLRHFSALTELDDDLSNWPRHKQNTLLNVCPQGNKMLVERLGKLHSIQEAGWFIAIPIIDSIRCWCFYNYSNIIECMLVPLSTI